MARRYGGAIEYIMSLPYPDGQAQIEYALDEDKEDKVYNRWIHEIHMNMSYDEFKQKIGASEEIKDDRTAEDILIMVEGIIG